MADLIYGAITSLDGYVTDADGDFGWAEPDEEVHAFVNDLERTTGTYLYGRRMYEVMTYWQDVPSLADEPPVIQDYAAIWQAADKVVFSRTLTSVQTPRTRLEPRFDPAAISALKESSDSDLSIGGADLAGQAIAAGLVDQCHLFVAPVVVGGGTPAFPSGIRARLELVDQHVFDGGMVHQHYAFVN